MVKMASVILDFVVYMNFHDPSFDVYTLLSL
jgi:hypothetical protein